jgi:hypothetical protein
MLLSADSFANVGEEAPGTNTGGNSDNVDRAVNVGPDGTIHNPDGSIEHLDGTIIRESDAKRNSKVG